MDARQSALEANKAALEHHWYAVEVHERAARFWDFCGRPDRAASERRKAKQRRDRAWLLYKRAADPYG